MLGLGSGRRLLSLGSISGRMLLLGLGLGLAEHKNCVRSRFGGPEPSRAPSTLGSFPGLFTVLLQEQHWSKLLDSSLLHHSWTLIEPTITVEQPPRTVIYIKNKAMSSAALKQV